MRWFWYEEDKVLGARLQGIIDPLVVIKREHDCELGYKGKNTPDLVLSLYQIFISVVFRENDDVIKITEMLKRLTLIEDITFFYEDLDDIETKEADMIDDDIVGVDMTWMNIGGKMMKGYEPGNGLRAKLQGIIEPIQPKFKKDTFGLGYKYTTEEYRDWESPLGRCCPLPNLLPTQHKTFRSAGFPDNLEEDILKSLSFFF